MGNKVFISYKYGDSDVYGNGSTVRDYIDYLQKLLKEKGHINKGEPDDTDLSDLADDTIQQKLADRMHDSTVTIVMISPNMKESGKSERKQWIPWEIAYSLRIEEREKGGKSYPNAILAVVLPDANKSYEYYIKITCPDCEARTLMTNTLFPILKKNILNIKSPEYFRCPHRDSSYYIGDSSYIQSVKWDDFVKNINYYIEKADEISNNIDNYNIVKKLEE